MENGTVRAESVLKRAERNRFQKNQFLSALNGTIETLLKYLSFLDLHPDPDPDQGRDHQEERLAKLRHSMLRIAFEA